jgi:hypothetical protein
MAQKTVTVNYLSRDFSSIRGDLINYLKTFFPEQWQDFNVTSPGMALLELNAYVGDLLSYATDKKYNELFIDGVQERRSVYRLAKTFGYKPPGVRPAISIADIIIEVPPTADGPDASYLPVYRSGMRVKGAGQTFETVNEIDFSSDFSEEGVANRIIEPIFNGNQDLIRYRIIKRELIKAGVTKIFKVEVPAGQAGPFYQVELPDKNVLEIVGVIVLNGLGINRTPSYSEFNDFQLQYFEVDSLPTDKIFLEDDSADDINGVKTGRYVEIEKRFEKEFLSDGSCVLTFGGGVEDYDAYAAYLTSLTNTVKCPDSNNLDVSVILNNTALGVQIPPNSTIFVKYRAGGGPLSNVGSNVLNEVSNIQSQSLGANLTLVQGVLSSTRANNPIPAIGGVGLPSVEEIKSYIAANYNSQNRAVTLDDYVARAFQIPGKFGAPFRIFGKIEDNKVKLYILTRDGAGKLFDISTSVVKENLQRYLVPYRMVNDFVEINDGKIINLQIEIDLFIDKTFNAGEVKAQAINSIKNYFDVERWQMNQNIYMAQLTDFLRDIPGVINVVDIRVFNMEGGGYSSSRHSQANFNRTQDPSTGAYRTQFEYIDNAIFGNPISMFEIKIPEKDILVRTASGTEINTSIT